MTVDGLLSDTGLSQEDLNRLEYIDLRDHVTILTNLDRETDDRTWAVQAGDQFSMTSHGPLSFAALSAPTLGAALSVMVDFQAIRTDSFRSQLQREQDYCQFEMWDLSGEEAYGQWITQSIIRILQILIQTILGYPPGDQLQIYFRCDQPDHADVLQARYGSPCHFSQTFNGFRIPASWWELRSPLHDEVSYRSNLAHCREMLASHLRGHEVSQQVRQILLTYFETAASEAPVGELPDLEQVAAALNVTSRTLIRHLKKEDNAYKNIVRQLRQQYAEQLLQNTHLSVAQISERLGYKEPANFSRAFSTWYGVSPATWRQNDALGHNE
jgi:AraC-like DNA-binding protein